MKENRVSDNNTSFEAFNLPESIAKNIKFMGFTSPTPIQEQSIPLALNGRDILGSAQTGTGKTAAFSIPAVVHVLNNPKSNVLILTPTRELAAQVLEHIKQIMGTHTKLSTALLIGGDSMEKQFKQLRARPRIVVGTPGRINDHLIRKTLVLSNTDFLVLDETDRMLDMGFVVQLEEIFPKLAQTRQTLMFSATFSPSILRMATDYLVEPERITVGSTTKPIESITQETIQTTDPEKYNLLIEQITKIDGSFIVFVKTKRDTEKLVERLRIDGYQADAIHGDLKQSKRDRVILRFRSKKTHILVATDVAARGLDIPHIECVVNYDLPHCPEDYIHRIGRTGRAGNEGVAISFITNQDRLRWRNINRLLNPGQREENKHRDGFDQERRPNSRRRRGGGFSSERTRSGSSSSERSRFSDSKERAPFGDSSERPRSRRDSSEKPRFGDSSERPRSRRDSSEKPRFGDSSERPRSRRDSSEKPRFDDSSERPRSRRDSSEKPRFGDSSEKPRSRNSSSEKPRFEESSERSRRTSSEKPASRRSFSDRPGSGFGEKRFKGRSDQGNKRSFGGKRGRD